MQISTPAVVIVCITNDASECQTIRLPRFRGEGNVVAVARESDTLAPCIGDATEAVGLVDVDVDCLAAT